MPTSSYPRYDGDIAGTFVKSLAVELVKLGHEVHVVAPDDGPPPAGTASSAKGGVVEHWFAYAPTERLRTMGYARSLDGDRHLRRATYAMIVPYLLAGYARTHAVVARHGCDVVHAHWALPGGPIGAAAAWGLCRPLVVSLHGSDAYVAERNRAFGAVAGWALARAQAVTACSGDLRARAVRLGATEQRSRVVPYGVSPELFVGHESAGATLRARLGIGRRDPVVLALGRLVYKKGFEYLIEAMPEVLAACPKARLVVAGDGALAGDLRARAERLGLESTLRMPGHVAWNEVPAYLAMADVFALPSVRDDAGNVDGLPNVLLEAMAATRPIAATRVAGVPEVIVDGKNGLLVEQRSSAALGEAIGRLLADRKAARRLAKAARRTIEERLSWARIAREFAALYAACRPR